MARGIKIVKKTLSTDEKPDKSSADDKLNQAIIKCLEEDGRMAFSEIAQELDVSEGTIRNRVKSMRQSNMLRIVALTDPIAVEYKSDAMLGLKISQGHSIQAVAERLASSPGVVYILWVSGCFDLLVEIVSNDSDNFLEFLDREIYSQKDIASVEIMSGLKNFKNQFLLKDSWN